MPVAEIPDRRTQRTCGAVGPIAKLYHNAPPHCPAAIDDVIALVVVYVGLSVCVSVETERQAFVRVREYIRLPNRGFKASLSSAL